MFLFFFLGTEENLLIMLRKFNENILEKDLFINLMQYLSVRNFPPKKLN